MGKFKVYNPKTSAKDSESDAPTVVKPMPRYEDGETVCIKLLGHLKGYSKSASKDWHFQVDLLTKSNASVQRLLQSRTVHQNYSCQLLLSSIMTQLTVLCECLCGMIQNDRPTYDHCVQQEGSSSNLIDLQTVFMRQPTWNVTISPLLLQALGLVQQLGNLLKGDAQNDFHVQAQGRQEAWMFELELRLRAALARW